MVPKTVDKYIERTSIIAKKWQWNLLLISNCNFCALSQKKI